MAQTIDFKQAKRERLDEQARQEYVRLWTPHVKRDIDAILLEVQALDDAREAGQVISMLIETTCLVQSYMRKCKHKSAERAHDPSYKD